MATPWNAALTSQILIIGRNPKSDAMSEGAEAEIWAIVVGMEIHGEYESYCEDGCLQMG